MKVTLEPRNRLIRCARWIQASSAKANRIFLIHINTPQLMSQIFSRSRAGFLSQQSNNGGLNDLKDIFQPKRFYDSKITGVYSLIQILVIQVYFCKVVQFCAAAYHHWKASQLLSQQQIWPAKAGSFLTNYYKTSKKKRCSISLRGNRCWQDTQRLPWWLPVM